MKSKFIVFISIALLLFFAFSCKKTNPAASDDPAANTATVTCTKTTTETATASPTATSSPTATATIKIVLDQHFDSTVEGWTLDPAKTGGVSIAFHDTDPYGALGTTGCAKVSCNFTGAGGYSTAASSLAIVYDFPSPVDLKRHSVSFNLYIPSSLSALSYGIQLEFSTVNNSTYHGVVSFGLTTSDWNSFQISYNSAPSDADQTNSVRFLIWMPASSTPWAGDIYLDEIYW